MLAAAEMGTTSPLDCVESPTIPDSVVADGRFGAGVPDITCPLKVLVGPVSGKTVAVAVF